VNIDQQYIDNLIVRYLSGEATAEEAMELDDWRQMSAGNEKYFQQYCFVNEKVMLANVSRKWDVDTAWLKLQTKLFGKAKRLIFRPIHWVGVAAAALLLFVSVTYILRQSVSKSVSVQTVAIASADSVCQKQLSDHSKIVLNRNSEIRYSDDFGKTNRTLALTGEAFFEVAHDAEKPFVVNAEGTVIRDIGTSFNINAFRDSSWVKVYVESGEVRFFTEKDSGLVLVAGEMGMYNKTTGQFSKKRMVERNVLSYKTMKFEFNNTCLSEICKTLAEAYHLKIELDSPDLARLKMSVSFDNEKIEQVLNIISETLDLSYVKTENGYLLKSSGKAQKTLL
jgi:ferric-dicitrate binding protein FerR (iron transport regulator)